MPARRTLDRRSSPGGRTHTVADVLVTAQLRCEPLAVLEELHLLHTNFVEEHTLLLFLLTLTPFP